MNKSPFIRILQKIALNQVKARGLIKIAKCVGDCTYFIEQENKFRKLMVYLVD
jgi:hypothetical protein